MYDSNSDMQTQLIITDRSENKQLKSVQQKQSFHCGLSYFRLVFVLWPQINKVMYFLCVIKEEKCFQMLKCAFAKFAFSPLLAPSLFQIFCRQGTLLFSLCVKAAHLCNTTFFSNLSSAQLCTLNMPAILY